MISMLSPFLGFHYFSCQRGLGVCQVANRTFHFYSNLRPLTFYKGVLND